MESSLAQLAGLAWISKSLAVAATLGIADQLENGPVTGASLAQATDTNAEALTRLMQVLSLVGVFQRDQDGRFTNTASSEQLRTRHPESLRNACTLAGDMYYDAWGGLMHTMRTGKPASRQVLGGSLYEYMERNPASAGVYDLAMQEWARPVAAELALDDRFEQARTVIDVGGGNGELLRGILAAHRQLRGVCVDRADVCRRAGAELRASGDDDLIARLSFRPADFFQECPGGGDLYLLKNVLHNWSPESSIRIMRTVREALHSSHGENKPEPLLLVIEPLVEHDRDAAVRALFQMVICEEGTRERTEAEMCSQVRAAGLRVRSITQLASGHSVIACGVTEHGPGDDG